MARYRQKPINPLVQMLMKKHGAKTIKELTDHYPEMEYDCLLGLADVEPTGEHHIYEAILRNARILGMSADEFLSQLLQKGDPAHI